MITKDESDFNFALMPALRGLVGVTNKLAQTELYGI